MERVESYHLTPLKTSTPPICQVNTQNIYSKHNSSPQWIYCCSQKVEQLLTVGEIEYCVSQASQSGPGLHPGNISLGAHRTLTDLA